MAKTYTSGVWTVKPGEDDAFVAAWTTFVSETETSGAGTFHLVRDADNPSRYMSFAPWESFDAQHDWRSSPGFAELIAAAQAHCDDFQSFTYELVTTVD